MMWADQVRKLSDQELSKAFFGPFFCDPTTKRLTLIQEIRRTYRDENKNFPVAPSRGWVEIDNRSIFWCPLGGESILLGSDLPDKIRSPFPIQPNLKRNEIINLIATGKAFVFCNDLYILPEEEFELNSFKYEIENHEDLSVFIGYRGHVSNYPEIITPSLLRKHKTPSKESYFEYKSDETYAANIIKQTFWEQQKIALHDIQARGIIQHHKILCDTDILDLSYDLNVAKWFSMNKWDSEKNRFVQKSFEENKESDAAYGEASLIYKVFVRIIGGSEEALPIKVSNQDVRLMPWNLSLLWSERPFRQKGFGIDGIRINDQDINGAVLNVMEYRFHPAAFPNGWDEIGGPTLRLFGKEYSFDEDTSELADQILPKEDKWFQDMEKYIKENTKAHNRVDGSASDN